MGEQFYTKEKPDALSADTKSMCTCTLLPALTMLWKGTNRQGKDVLCKLGCTLAAGQS